MYNLKREEKIPHHSNFTQHLWLVVSFRSFVTAPIFNLPLPTYPPIFHLHHRFWLMSGLGELFCTIKVFFFSFNFLLLLLRNENGGGGPMNRVSRNDPLNKTKLPPTHPPILLTYLNVIFKTLHHRHHRPFPLLFSWPLWSLCRATSAYDEFISACAATHNTKSGTCRWRTKGADVTLFLQKRYDLLCYAIMILI